MDGLYHMKRSSRAKEMQITQLILTAHVWPEQLVPLKTLMELAMFHWQLSTQITMVNMRVATPHVHFWHITIGETNFPKEIHHLRLQQTNTVVQVPLILLKPAGKDQTLTWHTLPLYMHTVTPMHGLTMMLSGLRHAVPKTSPPLWLSTTPNELNSDIHILRYKIFEITFYLSLTSN